MLEVVETVVDVLLVALVGELTVWVCVTVAVVVTVEDDMILRVWVVVVTLTSRLVKVVVSG